MADPFPRDIELKRLYDDDPEAQWWRHLKPRPPAGTPQPSPGHQP
jgi:hypothetical protein